MVQPLVNETKSEVIGTKTVKSKLWDQKCRNHKLMGPKVFLPRLWVAEGFVKPNKPQILEEVAEDYLKDLISRNLVMVAELGSTGTMKTCVMHDLVKDLCLRESHKSKFLTISNKFVNQVPFTVMEQQWRRIFLTNIFANDYLDYQTKYISFSQYIESIPHARSLSYNNDAYADTTKLALDNLKLLKIFSMFQDKSKGCNYLEGDAGEFASIELYNLRYIDAYLNQRIVSLNKISSLQTICIRDSHVNDVALDIWKMLDLRHLKSSSIYVREPSSCGLEDKSVLENLQTLTGITNVDLTEEFLTRIPNVKKLGLCYDRKNCYITCLDSLHKLESLKVRYLGWGKVNISVFPLTLKRLYLDECCKFDDVIINIGQLPNLEKLTMIRLYRAKWDSAQGQFGSLKFLRMHAINSLSVDNFVWTAESGHFPALESLVIENMSFEIPFDFAYSTTLRSIRLERCRGSKTIESAKEILEEQKSLGIEDCIGITVDGNNVV